MRDIKASDFTGLAEDYSKYRPGYSETVLDALLGICGKQHNQLDFADVGAGTGIWTRMVASRGVKSIVAIEPNDDMRRRGEQDSVGLDIQWRNGSGEDTGLVSESIDMLSMASSFHWTDFEKSTAEFHRVLRPRGRFVALWNPRLIEINPLLVEIEEELSRLKGGAVKRVSSGRSGITDSLTELLWGSRYFDDVVYIEGRHTKTFTPQEYLGVWRSVNDLQAQLGAEKFQAFLAFVTTKVSDLQCVEAVYLTRAWAAKRI